MKQILFLASAFLFAAPTQLSAHCQVPCGIYDNNNVIGTMHTDFLTIEKASKEIVELSKDPSANAQQIVRWTVNKDSHCQDIQDKVLNYFLAQRIKLPEDGKATEEYSKQIALCHAVIVTAMKCKQSTDAANVTKLQELLTEFKAAFETKE